MNLYFLLICRCNQSDFPLNTENYSSPYDVVIPSCFSNSTVTECTEFVFEQNVFQSTISSQVSDHLQLFVIDRSWKDNHQNLTADCGISTCICKNQGPIIQSVLEPTNWSRLEELPDNIRTLSSMSWQLCQARVGVGACQVRLVINLLLSWKPVKPLGERLT